MSALGSQAVTARRSLSPKFRVVLFERAQGRCHICECRIRVGELWDVEHVIPLALGGDDNLGNMAPAHKACHATKTATDAGDIARAKRREAKHLGIKKPSTFRRPPGVKYDWRAGRYRQETT